jgi:hypothetical protein
MSFETEIYIDAWESCPNCTDRFWSMQDPIIFCIWCDYLGCDQ